MHGLTRDRLEQQCFAEIDQNKTGLRQYTLDERREKPISVPYINNDQRTGCPDDRGEMADDNRKIRYLPERLK